MITGTKSLKLEYELCRLVRYGGIAQDHFYAEVDFHRAYREWSKTPINKRQPEWDHYCDLRDCVPLGTNANIRKRLLAKRYH